MKYLYTAIAIRDGKPAGRICSGTNKSETQLRAMAATRNRCSIHIRRDRVSEDTWNRYGPGWIKPESMSSR